MGMMRRSPPGSRVMMHIRPLRSEADYDAALLAIAEYFKHEPLPGSPEADRFDLLALALAIGDWRLAIGDYEAKHWASSEFC